MDRFEMQYDSQGDGRQQCRKREGLLLCVSASQKFKIWESLTSTISTSSPVFALFFLSLRSRIARLRKRVCITIQPSLDETHLSLSSLMLVMTTLLGWMPMGTVAPFDLSRWTRSTWMTHFLRYTWVTFPSRPLYLPRTILTSSSLRIGSDRVCY